jgi:hypothetical protein
MEGLGAAASVVAIVQITGTIFSLCWEYYTEAKDAKEHIKRLRNEVKSLQDVIAEIGELIDSPSSAKLAVLSSFNHQDGPLQQCLTDLTDLLMKLDKSQGKSSMRKFGLRSLKWPLSSKEVNNATTAIERHKSLFMLALNVDQT